VHRSGTERHPLTEHWRNSTALQHFYHAGKTPTPGLLDQTVLAMPLASALCGVTESLCGDASQSDLRGIWAI